MRQSVGSAVALLLVGTALLAGCSGMRLQDETRAKLAAETKEKYASAGVTQILDTEAKNLDVLHEESLKVVQENRKLQLDLALLDIAISQKPMARSLGEVHGRLALLGYPTQDLGNLAKLAEALEDKDVAQRAVDQFGGTLRMVAKATPPPCVLGQAPPTLEEWGKKTGADLKAQGVKSSFDLYVKHCNDFRSAALNDGLSPGLLVGVTGALDKERTEKKVRADGAAKAKDELARARKEYQTVADASAAALANCDKVEQGLSQAAADKLGDLKQALAAADKANLELSNNERIKQLLVLLEATAGGQVSASDESIKTAARIAQEFPSLWGDMCDLVARSKAPPVGNLLLALGHATLLAGHARTQEAFADQRIALLEQKQAYLRAEAVQWLRFLYAFCSYATSSSGTDCQKFTAEADGSRCALDGKTIANCPLAKRWAQNIRNPGSTVQTREMYKMLLAYQRAFALQSRADEVDFRMVDLVHRETLERKRLAVKDWDNLVGGAVAQLDAYYSAGLKPAEVADLIVKAVGFIAIAIGIAQ